MARHAGRRAAAAHDLDDIVVVKLGFEQRWPGGAFVARDAARSGPAVTLWLEKYAGTRGAGYAVILSVLFDAEGVAKGMRVVTDSRAPLDQRVCAHAMRMRIKPRYRGAEWDCVDLPLADGETPIGSRYIKELCQTVDAQGRRIVVRAHQFREPGQTGYDERGQYIEGDYESSTRWEIWDRSVPFD